MIYSNSEKHNLLHCLRALDGYSKGMSNIFVYANISIESNVTL